MADTEKKLHNSSAFTLIEMLIVVAIIAVLVAISIPVFTNSLEKTRETTDIANIRNACSEVKTEALLEGTSYIDRTVSLCQNKSGWQTDDLEADVNGFGTVSGTPVKGGTAVVEWKDLALYITFDGTAGEGGTPGEEPGSTSSSLGIRGSFMETAARGIEKGFRELIPEYKLAQADSCLHNGSYQSSVNDDYIVVKELHISSATLKRGVYWDPDMYTWEQLLTEAGVDLSGLENLGDNSYVYFDSDMNPVCISYYDEEGSYCYSYLDGSGDTVKMSKPDGERAHAAYFKDCAKSKGTY